MLSRTTRPPQGEVDMNRGLRVPARRAGAAIEHAGNRFSIVTFCIAHEGAARVEKCSWSQRRNGDSSGLQVGRKCSDRCP